MQLPRWALALADDNGCSGSANAALASVTSLPNLDERALVAEAQAGNRAAFEELVRRFDRDVLRLALNLMKRRKTLATFIRKPSSRFTAISTAFASNAASIPGSTASSPMSAWTTCADGRPVPKIKRRSSMPATTKKASPIFLNASASTDPRWTRNAP